MHLTPLSLSVNHFKLILLEDDRADKINRCRPAGLHELLDTVVVLVRYSILLLRKPNYVLWQLNIWSVGITFRLVQHHPVWRHRSSLCHVTLIIPPKVSAIRVIKFCFHIQFTSEGSCCDIS
jgi:hypothetical protein